MSRSKSNRSQLVVSPRLWAHILSSPELAGTIVPEGPGSSPYEVLDYDATLILEDVNGKIATFRRLQRIRFLQRGVSAIMDHAWGEGIVLTHYRNSAGPIADSLRDEGRRHLIIDLRRVMERGEEIAFCVERKAMESFLNADGLMETRVDHPIHRLRRSIVFPKARPVQAALLDDGSTVTELPLLTLANGRTMVQFDLQTPVADRSYTVRWRW